MLEYDSTNEMFRIAVELVNQSSRNIFLTGKAGTGKTTFLRYIRENCAKQLAVVAPTGVAAINAGGVTIHSFFQLPLNPFVPESNDLFGTGFQPDAAEDSQTPLNPHTLISRQRLNSEKLKVLRQLELLIIDEVSMVRCDTMDAIDTVLRHVRRRPMEKFGGVQVLFIGDLFQLSPVIRDETWSQLSPFYNSAYFFDSRVIREELPLYIEFNKIYRQSEQQFIDLLNQVRNNALDENGLSLLRSRFNPAFHRSADDGFIVLTTHNDTARDVNGKALNNLPGLLHSFKATVDRDFPPNSYPGEDNLQLKKGAQVMFIKNDPEKEKRFFNGKIGTITAITNDKISVQCKDEAEPIDIKREKWDNIRYAVNPVSRVMEEELLGSFSQFPLRLAWAITIHKSQGLTFEKAIIDVGKAFAPGQVYVALSRCTSLQGLVLQSQVNPNSLSNDRRILGFTTAALSGERLEAELAAAKKNYQQQLLINIFDFGDAIDRARTLLSYLQEHKSSFNESAVAALDEWLSKLATQQSTAIKFHPWIAQQIHSPGKPEENTVLYDRITKAASHFSQVLKSLLPELQSLPVVTDSKLHAKEYNENLREIFSQLSLKLFLLSDFSQPLNTDYWHQRKRQFVVPFVSTNSYGGETDEGSKENPVLHRQLRKLRSEICARKDLPIYLVAGTKTLDEMVRYLPLSLDDLQKISGFGKLKVEAYGQEFLDIIDDYCHKNGLTTRMGDKKKEPVKVKKEKGIGAKSPTKAETFRLFREGLNRQEIASKRKLAVATVESHLIDFVRSGEISILDVVEPSKVRLIEPLFNEKNKLNSIKAKLGDTITYADIRLTIAWIQHKQEGAAPIKNP